MGFIRATRERLKLRAALLGPAGSGKTLNALYIAKGLGGRTAVLDTEHGSARRYAHMFEFDTQELTNFTPENYEGVIREAERAGYDNLIIDSLSHAWAGKGGILEFVDNQAKRSSGNAFAPWRDATPKHNSLVETMLGCNLHLIVTMRVKMDYVVERDGTGRTVIRKVGLQPVQRDGLEYEFDLVCDVDINHNLVVSKSRFFELADRVYNKPNETLGMEIKAVLETGEPRAAATPAQPEPPVVSTVTLDDLLSQYSPEQIMAANDGRIPGTDEEVAAVAARLAPEGGNGG